MLVFSLALHGLVLWFPLSQSRPKKQPSPEKTVKVTRLPTVTRVAPTPSPRPAKTRKAQPSGRARPRVPATPAVASSRPAPTTPTTQPASDFPQYPGAQPGSLGLFQGEVDRSSQSTPDLLVQVSSYFQQQLTAKKFQFKLQQVNPRQVAYQISQGGTTQVLNLIYQEGRGTVIILSDRILSPGDNPTVILDDLVTILNQYLPAQPSDFPVPEHFYQNDQEHPATEGGYRLISDFDPASFLPDLQTQLQNRNFALTPAGNYQGSSLYEVTQGDFKRYFSLLPSQDGKGTLLVLWTQSPVP